MKRNLDRPFVLSEWKDTIREYHYDYPADYHAMRHAPCGTVVWLHSGDHLVCAKCQPIEYAKERIRPTSGGEAWCASSGHETRRGVPLVLAPT